MKGVFHIHTNYSSDSDCSLEQIVQKAMLLGYSFIVVVDHFEDMDKLQQQELINNCRKATLASYGIQVIPGIEVRFQNKAHILVLGLQTPLDSFEARDIESLRKSAVAQGALIGVAHVWHESTLLPEELACFDFIEVWNARYDKKFPPFRKLDMTRRFLSSCLVGGVDSHSIDEVASLWMETNEEDIVAAIKHRNVVTKNSILALDARGYIISNKILCYVVYSLWLCVKYLAGALGRLFIVARLNPPGILKKARKYIVG